MTKQKLSKEQILKNKIKMVIMDYFNSKSQFYIIVRKGEPYSIEEYKQLESYIDKIKI